MHVALLKFIASLEMQRRKYALTETTLVSDHITAHIAPTLSAEVPDAIELSWPAPGIPADTVYPILLLWAVFGVSFDAPALLERAASAFESGTVYSERIADWTVRSHVTNAKVHLLLEAA